MMDQDRIQVKSMRFRFHPLVRFLMIIVATIVAGYSIYFISVLIPRYEDTTLFPKIVSIIVLYVALSTLYTHLTSLNSIVIHNDRIELKFLIKKTITVKWDYLKRMEIYKLVKHYWTISYLNSKGEYKLFKTSLAFPGIIKALLRIQDLKPDVQMNELLKKVLLYERAKKIT